MSLWAEQNTENKGLRIINLMSFWAERNTEKKGLRTIKPYVILSGAEYEKERFKNNKTLCHSERSAAQPKNPGVAA